MDRDLGPRLRARAAGRRKVRVATTAAAVGGVVLTAGLGVAFAAADNPPGAGTTEPTTSAPSTSAPTTSAPTTSTRAPHRHQNRVGHRRPALQPPAVPPRTAPPGTSVPNAHSGGS